MQSVVIRFTEVIDMTVSPTTEVWRLYLNGQWQQPRDPLEVVNPATGNVTARVGTVGREAVAKALADAADAWPAWRRLSGKQRGEYLAKIADNLERRGNVVARTITLENGKPLAQSRGELAMTVDHLRWFAGEAPRAYGRIVPQQVEGKRHLVIRSPVGVVGAISPWNFPLVLAVRKVAPALAAGCPVVLKPASATPLCAVMFAEAVDEAGLPPGVFQLVVGRSAEIAAEMLENPICRKISFTGSTEVGRHLIRAAAGSIKKLSLELGGHAPVLVFEDADLDQAVQGTLIAKFRNTGQSCVAASRVYVQRSIYDKFLTALVARAKALKVGNGLEEGVEIGPLINAAALSQALEHIQEAAGRGAKILCGGHRWPGSDEGYFLEPTILTDVPADARCMREETFAPVAPVCPFDDEVEAVRLANATDYGLAAYAFTRDLSRTWRLAEALEAGTIAVNDPVPATSIGPFGGLKQSGWGRELGSEGIDAFLETKHVSLGIRGEVSIR
jgi:succinate-semialdehyde dehydrogenase/glutarate-semialdehyde dehydrogenase